MRRLYASICAAALAGCAVGPNYRTPPAPTGVPAGAFDAARPGTAALADLPDQWWRLYDDPALNELVEQALRENYDLRTAAANLAQAQAILDEARAELLPLTTVNAGGSVSKRSTGGNAVGGSSGTEFVYSGGFNVSYELDLFGRIRRTIEAARGDLSAQAAARDFTRVTVAAATTQAYVDACAYEQSANVARRSFQVVQQSYNLTAFQERAGALSDFEVVRERALLDQTGAAIPALEAQRRAALYQLAVLTGRPPEQVSPAARACAKPPPLRRPLPVGDGVGLLKRRPDVREAERFLAADTARIGISTADLYPTVTLGGSVSGAALNPTRLLDAHTIGYGVGPAVSWAFPNFVPARARIRAAQAVAQADLSRFDSTILTALQETEQALSTYAGALDRRVALQSARDNDARALQLAQTRYVAGSVSFLDLLTSQSTLVGDENALAVQEQAVADDQVAVFRALGGGWMDAPEVKPLPLDSTQKARTPKVHSNG